MPIYTPDDTLIQGIVNALGNIASTQIAGLGTIYTEEPDGPPSDNSVVFPMTGFKINSDTNGKLDIVLTFGMQHLHTPVMALQDLKAARRWLLPFLQAFGGWPNQNLGGLARAVTPKYGGTPRVIYAETPFQALLINIEVLTQMNIPTF